jgi:hypothetical protein
MDQILDNRCTSIQRLCFSQPYELVGPTDIDSFLRMNWHEVSCYTRGNRVRTKRVLREKGSHERFDWHQMISDARVRLIALQQSRKDE